MNKPFIISIELSDFISACSRTSCQGRMRLSDKDGDGLLTFAEFKASVASFGQPQQAATGPSDPIPKADQALLQMLYDYLSENEDVLKKYFEQADQDKKGNDRLAGGRMVDSLVRVWICNGSVMDLSFSFTHES